MRSNEEVREAIATLGTTFLSYEVRRYVWGSYEHEAGKAVAMFQALCWAVGASAGVDEMLEYARLKLAQYAEQEKSHVQ
jgi:hypothetical protein